MTSSAHPGSRLERLALLFLFGAAVVLRLLYAFHFRIDSDEPQHLHVVWGWTQGQLPYRDYFDNHMPLFQAAMAPLFQAFSPRADIVQWMRLAMLPLFLVNVWLVQRIAAQLAGQRVGWWTAALTALFPPFLLLSTEFRPDNLWALLWLVLLSMLIRGRFTLARSLGMGLLLGLTFCVSLKTSLLVVAMLLGALALIPAPVRWPEFLPRIALLLLTAAIPPALVGLFFYSRGAWADFSYCVIGHNTSVQSKVSTHLLRQTFLWLPCFALTLAAALGLRRILPERRAAFASAYLFFTAASYMTVLRCFWPMFALEDYIPFFPALFAGLLPPLLFLAGRRLPRAQLPLWGVAAELACLLIAVPPWTDATRDKTGLIADVLRLTDPTDYILDLKGETVYRRRAIYPAIESVTRRGMLLGQIPADFSQDLIKKTVPVVSPHRMPTQAKPFLKDNYLPIAFRLHVLGQALFKSETPCPPLLQFKIEVPARYRIVTKSGPLPGTLNGRPFTGAEYLATGPYTFAPADHPPGPIVLIWAQALERGYSPFAPIKEDYNTDQD